MLLLSNLKHVTGDLTHLITMPQKQIWTLLPSLNHKRTVRKHTHFLHKQNSTCPCPSHTHTQFEQTVNYGKTKQAQSNPETHSCCPVHLPLLQSPADPQMLDAAQSSHHGHNDQSEVNVLEYI